MWAKSGGTLAISKRSWGRLVILKVEGGMPAISKDMGGIAAICRTINLKRANLKQDLQKCHLTLQRHGAC